MFLLVRQHETSSTSPVISFDRVHNTLLEITLPNIFHSLSSIVELSQLPPPSSYFDSESDKTERQTPSTMSKEMPNVANLSLGSGTNTPASDRSASKATSVSSVKGTSGPVYTPFEHAPESCTPVAAKALTPDQSAKYTQLLDLVSAWPGLPVSSTDKTNEPLTDNERLWLTRECLLRYLRATSWSVPNAATRLQDTLVWRKEYGVETWTPEHISPENETGKQVILGYDNNARPCLYLNPGKQNTKKSERQIQHLVYMLDRVIDMMDAGQETTALLINFKGSSSGGSPSVAQGRQVMGILQGHYPERLGRACIADRMLSTPGIAVTISLCLGPG